MGLLLYCYVIATCCYVIGCALSRFDLASISRPCSSRSRGALRLELKTVPAHCCPAVMLRLELKTVPAACCPAVTLQLELKTVPAHCCPAVTLWLELKTMPAPCYPAILEYHTRSPDFGTELDLDRPYRRS